MSKPSIRQTILADSVQRLLPGDERVHSVVMMTTRHRYFFPYAIFAGIFIFVVASLSGIEGVVNRVVLGGCGMAIAGMATTNHVALAETSEGMVLLRCSKLRQYAKELTHRLPAKTTITMVASNVITSDWKIESVIYTMTKRWEAAMRQISQQQ